MEHKRDHAVDALRCVLMFGVVLQHVISLSPLGCDPFAVTSTAVLVALTFPSVDGFTAVSGFFGVRCTFAKLVNLIGLVLFSGTLSCLISSLSSPCSLSFSWFRYWYVGAYIKLLLASLILNPILCWLDSQKTTYKILALTSLVLISYLSTIWLPWVSHSPRTVIFVYLVTRLLVMIIGKRKYADFVKTLSRGGLLICLLLVGILGGLGMGEIVHDYANPLTIVTGVLLVFVAHSFATRNEWGIMRFCAKISPSMIVVYMLHVSLLKTLLAALPMLIIRKIPFLGLGGSCFVVALIAFAICCLIDSIRRFVISYIRNR